MRLWLVLPLTGRGELPRRDMLGRFARSLWHPYFYRLLVWEYHSTNDEKEAFKSMWVILECSLARLPTVTTAISSAVVTMIETTSIVVTKFDDDRITLLHLRGHGCEMTIWRKKLDQWIVREQSNINTTEQHDVPLVYDRADVPAIAWSTTSRLKYGCTTAPQPNFIDGLVVCAMRRTGNFIYEIPCVPRPVPPIAQVESPVRWRVAHSPCCMPDKTTTAERRIFATILIDLLI